MNPQIAQIPRMLSKKPWSLKSTGLHYRLAESCFSGRVFRFPVKSANL
jgi:hypothetical protein